MHDDAAVSMHFSEYFGIDSDSLEAAGVFNISLINDLPLFIDPFLLFNSTKPEYQELHEGIIRYLRFLRDRSVAQRVTKGLLLAWYTFSEVKQTWLGFSRVGNRGRGLGSDFAHALNKNLYTVFSNFGHEQITRGSHLEKLCLIEEGVGRDNISDFTTNLIKHYLLEYTQRFAREYLRSEQRRRVVIARARFNYRSETWECGSYELPFYRDDYVLLTPKDILTRDEIWINRSDLLDAYDQIVAAIPNEQLRDQINNYLLKHLPEESPTPGDKRRAAVQSLAAFPQMVEYYIRWKEERGDRAVSISEEKVSETQQLFVTQAQQFAAAVLRYTPFYQCGGNTFDEARERVMFLKDVIENKGGHRLFYLHGEPVRREADLHLLFRLTWYATPSDISREVNDGRGPADFKVSRGAFDKSIVEFKLASNPQIRRNLERQAPIYQRASDAGKALKVIVYFTRSELDRVSAILRDLGLQVDESVILIDARSDNKPSGSKA